MRDQSPHRSKTRRSTDAVEQLANWFCDPRKSLPLLDQDRESRSACLERIEAIQLCSEPDCNIRASAILAMVCLRVRDPLCISRYSSEKDSPVNFRIGNRDMQIGHLEKQNAKEFVEFLIRLRIFQETVLLEAEEIRYVEPCFEKIFEKTIPELEASLNCKIERSIIVRKDKKITYIITVNS